MHLLEVFSRISSSPLQVVACRALSNSITDTIIRGEHIYIQTRTFIVTGKTAYCVFPVKRVLLRNSAEYNRGKSLRHTLALGNSRESVRVQNQKPRTSHFPDLKWHPSSVSEDYKSIVVSLIRTHLWHNIRTKQILRRISSTCIYKVHPIAQVLHCLANMYAVLKFLSTYLVYRFARCDPTLMGRRSMRRHTGTPILDE